MEHSTFDWQGHRGARGLYPENSIEAFLGALKYKHVTTLELDVVLSADRKVVVSHEPWMNAVFCLDNAGNSFEDGKQYNLFKMTYEEIKQFDCGSKIHPKYPDQEKLKTYKPLLSEVIATLEKHCEEANSPKIAYNIELKSNPEEIGIFYEKPKPYVEFVMEVLKKHDVLDRVTLQSFDTNVIEELHIQKSTNFISYLVENGKAFEVNLEKLSFIPDIYSPYYIFVTNDLVKKVHEKQMKLIPWTVNEIEEMKKLKALGVDGIITDYPNKIKAVEDE